MNKEIDRLKKKNILYIVHNYNNFQKDPIEEASKYFNKVYVLVRYKPISDIVDKIPLKSLKKFRKEYVLDLRELPSNVEVIKTAVWYFPYGFLNRYLGDLHFNSFKKVLRRKYIKFDLIHSHFVWSSGYVGMKLKKEYGTPLVITGHGYDVYKLPFKSKYWRKKIKGILDSADCIITGSKSNKRRLEELGIDMLKVSIINNGFSSNLFYNKDKRVLRKEMGIDESLRICLSVGNLEKVKGHDVLIKAISILKDKGENVFCYIIGTGSRLNYLKRLAKKYGVDSNVSFLGVKPHSEICDYINISDVFVLPSRNEGAPVVLLEALACGKPVVASKVGNVKDILESRDCGYIVNPEDSKALADAISKSLNRNWNTNGIVEYAKRFSWENSVKEILRIYIKVIKNE
ncbi:MAG TPA: glycosyltransferase [Candidatus Pacearchaeota archaeon]|jgi:glycosyltransferase involved in cell wall biosynthesis|nr:glycosyltransferase [Candidatus Pacearchaeota archaeon]